jgi:hypothetical protein
MPQSIEQVLKESKEIIERSRKLRERSRQTMRQFVYLNGSLGISHDANKPLGGMSAEAKQTIRPLVDSRKIQPFSK